MRIDELTRVDFVPVQNSYCDHRDFDNVNQPQQTFFFNSKLITLASFKDTVCFRTSFYNVEIYHNKKGQYHFFHIHYRKNIQRPLKIHSDIFSIFLQQFLRGILLAPTKSSPQRSLVAKQRNCQLPNNLMESVCAQ